ncbi:MAG: 50S ribosomal protein L25/general stress protein Ctc [Chromatiales bacterium]|jgi:large subunit ribosomal protein L25
MSFSFELNVNARSDTGKGASRRLRKSGLVPGIIYGANKDPEMISMPHNVLIQQLENEAFYSHILTVNVDGKSQQVVLKDLQRHPSKPFVTHMDLLRVSASDKIKMHVPLHFINEDTAPGVKAGGKVTHNISDVEISCLPKDLPEYIEVDLGQMEIDDIIHLSDIKLADGVEITQLALGEDHDAAVVAIHTARGGAAEDEGEEEEAAED